MKLIFIFFILTNIALAEDQIASAKAEKTVSEIINNVCLQCHGGDMSPDLADKDLDFLKNYQLQATKYKRKGFKTIYDLLKNKQMPPRGFDKSLDDCERDQILAVLNSTHIITTPNCDPLSF